MDQDVLVDSLQNLYLKLDQQYGPVHLLMFLALDPDLEDDYWNVVVSAKGLDSSSWGDAIGKVTELLAGTVSKKVWQGIGRVTVLRSDDPFVKEMNRSFRAEDTALHLQAVKVSGIDISKAIVLQSKAA